MKLEVTKEWCLAMARREGNAEVGAGVLAFDPERDEVSDAPSAPSVRMDEQQVAFGPFVQLMRRKQGLTIERLAEQADLDLSELVIIEKEPHYRPEPIRSTNWPWCLKCQLDDCWSCQETRSRRTCDFGRRQYGSPRDPD